MARVSVLLLALAPFAAQGHELLRNGGFESGLDGWRPLDMAGGTKFEVDTQVKHSGKQSARIVRTAAGRPDFLKCSIDLPAKTGKVALSVAFKVDKDAHARIDAYFFDAAGETLGKGYITLVDAQPTKGFEVAKGEHEIPDKATGFGINVVIDKPGTVWIDSVSVTLAQDAKPAARMKPGTALLENGRFDESLDGWTELLHGSGDTVARRDTSVHAGGAGSLELVRTNPRLFPEDGVQSLVLEPGSAKRFTLALSSRTAADARAVVALQAFDAGGLVLATARRDLAPGEKFASATLTLELAAPCAKLAVTLAIRGAGTVWFDEIVLEGK